MAQAGAKVIQADITRAFSVRPQKVFHRENNQIYAIVGTNPALGVVSDVWFNSFDNQEEFRAVLRYILEQFKAPGMRYWLADLRFMASEFSASEKWLVEDLAPAAFRAGLEREAVVLPDGAVNKEGEDAYLSASGALRQIADGRVRGFTDIQLAKRWLLDGALPD